MISCIQTCLVWNHRLPGQDFMHYFICEKFMRHYIFNCVNSAIRLLIKPFPDYTFDVGVPVQEMERKEGRGSCVGDEKKGRVLVCL